MVFNNLNTFNNVVNIQPYLDYFRLLQRFEQKGFLDVITDKHEAYVTMPAIHAMSAGNDPMEQMKKEIQQTVKNIRTYAAFKSKDSDYLKKPFAVHVVNEEPPHDLVYTVIIQRQRRWRTMWRDVETIEVVSYEG